MSVSDPIGDMLVRVRNASMAGLETAEIPFSKMKESIARVLKKEGFIRDFAAEGGGAKKLLRVYLKYGEGRKPEPVIRGLKRLSSPGLRRYTKKTAIRPVRFGTGVGILSTSKGVMTDNDARKHGLGGEMLCTIW